MKWFFAFNKETEWYDNYVRYVKCAVNSAISNTSLEPNFVYDGEEDELTEHLREKGVKIHFKRSRFYDFFKNKEGLNHKVAAGAYLRAEIPEMTDDKFVLYTDCDVMFQNDVSELSSLAPESFSCSTEISPHNWSYFNSGVMLMNTISMRNDMSKFEDLVINSPLNVLSKYDQESYNLYYKNKWSKLPVIYNWKPYWGINNKAKIIHFHGLKVENIERIFDGEKVQPIQERFFNMSKSGYKDFYKKAIQFEES